MGIVLITYFKFLYLIFRLRLLVNTQQVKEAIELVKITYLGTKLRRKMAVLRCLLRSILCTRGDFPPSLLNLGMEL